MGAGEGGVEDRAGLRRDECKWEWVLGCIHGVQLRVGDRVPSRTVSSDAIQSTFIYVMSLTLQLWDIFFILERCRNSSEMTCPWSSMIIKA